MPSSSRPGELILASGSRYRAELLERLQLPFSIRIPGIDEKPAPEEAPAALAQRLAREKARAVAVTSPTAVVIGSDQVATCDGAVVGKPGTAERAVEQLLRFSGRDVRFETAVALQCLESGFLREVTVPTDVAFRTFGREEAIRYVELDRPLDCAGGFRAEAAGVVLMRHLRSDDPTAIVGLPLIALTGLLRQAGFMLP